MVYNINACLPNMMGDITLNEGGNSCQYH